MEVIMRPERKRRHSAADKASLMFDCDAPGSSVNAVAKRYDMATSVLHRWRLLRKNARAAVSTPMKFVAFGDIDDIASGDRAAAIYMLIETAKLNAVNPQDWLTDVLDRVRKGHPINRIDERLPWNWVRWKNRGAGDFVSLRLSDDQ